MRYAHVEGNRAREIIRQILGRRGGWALPRYTLEQSDTRPVRFSGVLLAEVGAPESVGKFSRWHELRLYKTDSGKYVLNIVFRSNATNSDGERIEPEDHLVEVCDSPDGVDKALRDYDPLEFVVGFPKGILDWKKKQERLLASVELEFQTRVGKLLKEAAKFDAGFVEEI